MAEYWVRVYDSSDYKVIYRTNRFDNWFNDFSSNKKQLDMPKEYFSPYSTGGKYYFINESFSYESKWLKLYEHPVWGENSNEGKVIADWEYGC